MEKYDFEAQSRLYDFSSFEDRAVRRGFIRKVFAILAAQLILVTVMILFTMLLQSIYKIDENPKVASGLLIGSVVVYMISLLVLICVPGLRKQYPMNIIMLFIITVSSGFMLSMICAIYTVESVLMALGITILCCAAIFVFSFNTKYDLSSYHGLAFCLLWGLFLSALLMPIPYSTPLNKVYAGIGAIIFMFLLIYNIHRVMGKSSENALSPEEYILAALEIYLNVVNIFMYILQLSGNR